MKDKTDSECLSNKVFSIINWIDFSFNQRFFYKNTELTNDYIYLYASFLFYMVCDKENVFDSAIRDYLHESLSKVLNELPQTDEVICVSRIKHHLLFGNKTDFRYLLISQLFYTFELIGIPVKVDFRNLLQEKLLFNEKEFAKVLNNIINPKLITDKKIIQSFSDYLDFKEALSSYNSLRIANIGVCATMSAGKSTFVNALLGDDYLPSRNEATTARITSVYDNDHSQKLIGFTMSGNKLAEIESNVSEKDVDSWNSDSDITRIFLQGDLDNIGNNGIVVSVHDTPGTNNSGDKNHHDITVNFLSSQKFDVLIFVANATQLCINDEYELLKEIYEKVVKPNNLPVIFVLNKADEFDPEKEDISQIITKYSDYLCEIGFENPKIFPVSSKAARLLKMAKKGRSENLSGRNKKELKTIQAEFSDLTSTGIPQVEKYIEKIIGGQ